MKGFDYVEKGSVVLVDHKLAEVTRTTKSRFWAQVGDESVKFVKNSGKEYGGSRQAVPADTPHQHEKFDGVPYPLPDNREDLIVRSIHEGCCPQCGRNNLSVTDGDWDNPAGEIRVICPDGHKAGVGREREDWDWYGWVERVD